MSWNTDLFRITVQIFKQGKQRLHSFSYWRLQDFVCELPEMVSYKNENGVDRNQGSRRQCWAERCVHLWRSSWEGVADSWSTGTIFELLCRYLSDLQLFLKHKQKLLTSAFPLPKVKLTRFHCCFECRVIAVILAVSLDQLPINPLSFWPVF